MKKEEKCNQERLKKLKENLKYVKSVEIILNTLIKEVDENKLN